MSYPMGQSNAVFLIPLVDEYGAPVVGVTSPAVRLSRAQLIVGTTLEMVEDVDYTWRELTNGEAFKGVYKLRQTDSPNVSAVDTEGTCAISVYQTDHDTAAGVVVYQVRAAVESVQPGEIADAVWDEAVTGHGNAGTFGEEVHTSKAMLANQREHAIATGVDVVKDNDGTTTLRTMTPVDGGDTIIVTPS
ncbi:MAG: hypothetical protein GY842_08675 [bacterium]|nr:hypothetical protein [bacterium]